MARKSKANASTDASTEKPKKGRAKKVKPDISNMPDPTQVAYCFAEMQSIEVDRLRLRARGDATLKRYERSHGVDPKTIQNMLREAKKDPGEIARQQRMDREYRRMLGHTRMQPDGQTSIAVESLMPADPPVASVDGQARVAAAMAAMDGYNTGLAGGTAEHNPHDPGAEQHVKWLEGFHDGHADRVLKNPDADKTTEASTRRTRREPTPPAEPIDVAEMSAEIDRELAERETESVH